MRRTAAASLALLSVGVTTGFAVWSDDLFAIRKAYETFGSVFETLVGSYADPVDAERVVRRGIDAMLATTDPYTVFYDERTLAQSQLSRSGVGQPGVELVEQQGEVVVGMPGDDATAYVEGLRPGDVVVSVDAVPVAPERGTRLGLADVYARLAGAPGTHVAVVVRRAGVAEPLRFDLTRMTARRTSVTFDGFVGADTTGGVGLIRLAQFGETSGSETVTAARRLHDTGRLRALVLDLRGNPGGLVEAAADIVGLFVPQGTAVVTTRERRPDAARAFRTSEPPLLPDLPVVVLVDDHSASASEIVAGALQDLDRAVVVGTETFGKGLIQRVMPLPYRNGLKITQGRYLLPSGRVVQRLVYVDGKPQEVPEAERRAFRTAAGRTVRDGRGIEPDLKTSDATPSEFVADLEREGAFVRFAAERASRPGATADVTAADVSAFTDWLSRGRTTALTPAERTADSLIAHLTAAGSPAAAEARRLRERLVADRTSLYARDAAALRSRLAEATLALATAGARTSMRTAYARDATLATALDLLADEARYRRLLGR